MDWRAPIEPFPYGDMAQVAGAEAATLRRLLDRLRRERPACAERELLRRREIRLLSDMYYEQRRNARLFAGRAAQRAATYPGTAGPAEAAAACGGRGRSG